MKEQKTERATDRQIEIQGDLLCFNQLFPPPSERRGRVSFNLLGSSQCCVPKLQLATVHVGKWKSQYRLQQNIGIEGMGHSVDMKNQLTYRHSASLSSSHFSIVDPIYR